MPRKHARPAARKELARIRARMAQKARPPRVVMIHSDHHRGRAASDFALALAYAYARPARFMGVDRGSPQ